MQLLNRIAGLLPVLMLAALTTLAGYKPGDEIQPFALKATTGKMVDMVKDYPKAKGFIIVFTCNHCPFAKLYQQRLNDLNTRYAPQGYAVLAISSNDADAVPEDSFEEMKKRADEQQYNYPYLYDETQTVARAFGAYKTPHAYVVQRQGKSWVVRYSGAIDDNGAEPEKIQHPFVTEAVDALLHGQDVATTTTKSVGCAIKWKTR